MKLQTFTIVSILFLLTFFSINSSNAGVVQKITAKIDTAVTNTKNTVVSAVHKTDTSSTFREIYYDLKEGVIALAKGLKTSVEHVFIVLVKQQYMLGALDLCKLLLLLFIFWRISVYIKNKEKDIAWITSWDADIIRVFYVAFGLFVIYIGFTDYLPSIFQRFINPEYPVYLQVIDIVKQLKE